MRVDCRFEDGQQKHIEVIVCHSSKKNVCHSNKKHMIPLLRNGLTGTRQADTLKTIPNFHLPYKQVGNRRAFVIEPTPTPQKTLNGAINYSMHRVVLPCDPLGYKVIRRPPVPDSEGLQPPTGVGRHQFKGLAYQKIKPIDLPVMKRAGFYNPSIPNPLGQPD